MHLTMLSKKGSDKFTSLRKLLSSLLMASCKAITLLSSLMERLVLARHTQC